MRFYFYIACVSLLVKSGSCFSLPAQPLPQANDEIRELLSRSNVHVLEQEFPGGEQVEAALLSILRSNWYPNHKRFPGLMLYSEYGPVMRKFPDAAVHRKKLLSFGLDAPLLKKQLEEMVSKKLGLTLRVFHMAVAISSGGQAWHVDGIETRNLTLVWPLGGLATGVRYKPELDQQQIQIDKPTIHDHLILHAHGTGPRLIGWFKHKS